MQFRDAFIGKESSELSSRTLVPVAASVLRWARESIGASVDEAAKRLQQDADTVLSWENATDEAAVSIANLRELADLYDRPLSVFLLDEPPIERPQPTDLRASAGRETGPLTRHSRMAIRQARRIQALVQEMRGAGSWSPPAAIDDASDEATVAMAFRRNLRISHDEQATWADPSRAFSHWRAAVEEIGIVVIQADVPLDDVRAMSIAGDPPVIIINEHDWPASKVFSLFHECWHILVGSEAICTPLERPGQMAGRERAADLFAGAVLVPATELQANELIKDYGVRASEVTTRDLRQIASAFSVSTRVIWYRLRQTARITPRQFNRRWDELGHPVKRKRLSVTPPKIARWQKARWRVGPRLASELIAGQERGVIPIGSALRGLGLHLEDIDRLSESIRE